MTDRIEKVVVVGQGYVGLPLAMRAVEVGYDVVGYELDEWRAKQLEAGVSYVEDVSDEQLTANLNTGRYRPTNLLSETCGFDYAVITVPTPLRDGNPDLSFIESAARDLARTLSYGATIILESTTYPGTTEELLGPLLEEGSGLVCGRDFHLGYSPERIDPGNPTWNFANTPKVVSGVDADSLAAVQRLYGSLVETLVSVSTKEAELTKLLENTFRHTNIALINELAMFAADLDIDIWAAIDAANTKPFGFMRFTPGPGVGGHCLPIDPSYLSWRVRRTLGMNFRFVELANDVNDHMPDYVVRRLTNGLNRLKKPVNGSRILLLGLAYKRNTGDAREAPGIRICDLLLQLGAHVAAADPHVQQVQVRPDIERVELTADEVSRADAIVLVTDHDAFDYSLLKNANAYVLDTRHQIPSDVAEHL